MTSPSRYPPWPLAAREIARCLSAEEVERLIAARGGTESGQLRDRAILLMLARLGLRSGDVAGTQAEACITKSLFLCLARRFRQRQTGCFRRRDGHKNDGPSYGSLRRRRGVLLERHGYRVGVLTVDGEEHRETAGAAQRLRQRYVDLIQANVDILRAGIGHRQRRVPILHVTGVA